MDRRTALKLGAASCAFLLTGAKNPPRSAFVRREGGRLTLEGRPFRYIGANMPEVTHIRTDWDLEQGRRFRLPTTDEIDWMVETCAQANFKVVRTWCFPSFLQPENPAATHYFRRNADGRTVTLNENAFRLFDYFLDRCGAAGIRAQVPFVYLAKERQWADASGDPHPQLLDFVARVVTRVNTRNRVAYRDDPAIFCWESGNEAAPGKRWLSALAAYVKRLDPNHLFMDGRWGTTDIWDSYQDAELASDPNIDLVSVHTYEDRPKGWTSARAIGELDKLLKPTGKVLDVGEVDPKTSVGELKEILDATIASGAAGATWWSFKGARAKGGYTQWNGREWGPNDDLKWPGFESPLPGVATEKAKVDLLCGAAYAIEGRRRPTRLPRPTPAKLLPITDVGHVSWIPGVGEQVADIQRSTRRDGGFVTVAAGFETFKGSAYDLWCDPTAEVGRAYYYRIISRNSGGAAEPSNVVGPVAVPAKWLVDDFWNLDKTQARSSGCRILSDYDLVPYHADLSVLKSFGGPQHVTYRAPGGLTSLLLIANRDTATLHFEGSEDGETYSPLKAVRRVHPPLHPEFAGHPRVTYRLENRARPATNHLRVRFGADDVISRLEMAFGG